jgi:hypothetical protein
MFSTYDCTVSHRRTPDGGHVLTLGSEEGLIREAVQAGRISADLNLYHGTQVIAVAPDLKTATIDVDHGVTGC